MSKRYHYVAWYGDTIVAQIADDRDNLTYWQVRGRMATDDSNSVDNRSYLHCAVIKLYDTHDNAKPATIVERR